MQRQTCAAEGHPLSSRVSGVIDLSSGRESAKVGTEADGQMAKTINYGQLMHKALRQMLAEVLARVAREGLPGKHHFFITFDTSHPGVDMSPALRARYPKEEMTIVLQEFFEDLAVMKDRFTVSLSFGGVLEPIVIPFDAIKTFVDPSVEFGLRFDAHPAEEGGAEEAAEGAPAAATAGDESAPAGAGEVVSLDKFRKH
jgi:hypothetical protein